MSTLEYLNKLRKKIEDKDLEVFWLMVDREDFKPIKNHSDKQIKELFKKKIKYYAGKRIAIVKIFVKNKESYIEKNDSLVHLVFDIRTISDRGMLNDTGSSLKIKYYLHSIEFAKANSIMCDCGRRIFFASQNIYTPHQDDLDIKKPTLKDVQRFTKLCADKILGSTVIGGLKYLDLMKELKTKKIKF